MEIKEIAKMINRHFTTNYQLSNITKIIGIELTNKIGGNIIRKRLYDRNIVNQATVNIITEELTKALGLDDLEIISYANPIPCTLFKLNGDVQFAMVNGELFFILEDEEFIKPEMIHNEEMNFYKLMCNMFYNPEKKGVFIPMENIGSPNELIPIKQEAQEDFNKLLIPFKKYFTF